MDQLLARTSSGGTTAWYLPDKLGSVRDIVSTTGTELDHIAYDSFGNIVTETNAANGDRFKFAGMQFDSASSLYFDRREVVHRERGRFVSLDPTGFSAGDTDLYRYAGNDASNAVDPTGLSFSQSVSDYWHYLTNPGDMDPDLQSAHNAAMTTLERDDVFDDRDGRGSWRVCVRRLNSAVGAAFYGITSMINGGADLEVQILKGAVAGGRLGFVYCPFTGLDVLPMRAGRRLLRLLCAGLHPDARRRQGDPEYPARRPRDIEPRRRSRGRCGSRVVEEVFENYLPTLDLRVNGRTIRTTAEHPFWVRGRGWVPAQQLRAGDQLRHDRRWLPVDGIDGPMAPGRSTTFPWRIIAATSSGTGCGALQSGPITLRRACRQRARVTPRLWRGLWPGDPKKIGKDELHHVAPIFLGGSKSGTKIPLPPAYHQGMTSRFRELWPYGSGKPPGAIARDIMKEVYKDYPPPAGHSWTYTMPPLWL